MPDPTPWTDMGVNMPDINMPFSAAAAVVLVLALLWMIKHEGTDWPGVTLGVIFGVLVAQTKIGDGARIAVAKVGELIVALVGVFS